VHTYLNMLIYEACNGARQNRPSYNLKMKNSNVTTTTKRFSMNIFALAQCHSADYVLHVKAADNRLFLNKTLAYRA
jgi:hypothetical protein